MASRAAFGLRVVVCRPLLYIIRPALLCQLPEHSKRVRNLCVGIYRHDSLSNGKPDKDVHHSVFTRSDLYLGAEHFLEHVAHILHSYPPESIVESMGSVIEKFVLSPPWI